MKPRPAPPDRRKSSDEYDRFRDLAKRLISVQNKEIKGQEKKSR